ncbi:MAG: tripartite tricarboxylate transporter TctB family protein [Nitrospinae bacterium]|nr:tripartite tricarboxylate transporter TctB family protein [Nitrospinota bacterium]
MASDEESTSAPSPTMLRLEVYLAGGMTLLAAGFAVFMPYLIASGGITSAQEFLRLSPIFFPELAFAVLAVLCAFYTLDAWRRARYVRSAADTNEAERFIRGAKMIVIVAAYSLLVSALGYGLSTLLMAGAVIWYLGIRQIWIVASVSILMPIVVRFIFERLLLISLPRSDYEAIAVVEDAIMKFLSGVFLGK